MKMDKKIVAFIVGLLAIIIIGGCITKEDPEQVFRDALIKEKNITSMEGTYLATSTMIDKKISSISSEVTTFIKDDKRLDEMRWEVESKPMFGKVYILGSDTYICTEASGNWACTKPGYSVPSPEFSKMMMENLFNKGAFFFGDGVEDKIIAERECKDVKMAVDISKLSKDEKGFILALGALPQFAGLDEYLLAIKTFDMAICIDTKTGVGIRNNIHLELVKNQLPEGAIYATEINVTLTEFKLNVMIPDNVFLLPKSNI